jgi:signal transduction histidine kinase
MTNTRRLLLQVTLPAVLVGLGLLVGSLLGVWSIHRLQQNRARLLSSNVRSLLVAQKMEVRLRQVRAHSILYVVEPTTQRRQVYLEDCRQFEETLAAARELAELPSEKRLLEEVARGYRRYRRDVEAARVQAEKWTSPRDLIHWADAHPVRLLLEPCEELLRIDGRTMEQTAQESEAVSEQGRALFLLMGVLGPVGGLISGFGAAWGLSRSITRMRIRLQAASAHLDQELGTVRVTGEGAGHQLERQLDLVVSRVQEAVERLQHQQQELIRTEQLAALGQLAASIAHEVRNPLTGIKLLVSATLQRQPADTLSTEDLQFIHGEIQRLEKKLQALLEFARPSQPRREPCDLRELIGNAWQLVGTRAGQLRVRPELDLPPGPVRALVDRDQFTSVLVNLFLNALDAMPEGGVLSVSLRQSSSGGVELVVADTGPGIDPSLARRLFTPFASTKKTGTGLGLSISRRVIADHGGTLNGSNRPQGGACFTITLPGQQ